MGTRRGSCLWGSLLAAGALLAADVGPAAGATIHSPPGEVFAYGANPSRTGESSENGIFGPLYEDWTVNFENPVHQPLVVGSTVLVASTGYTGGDPGYVTALSAADGNLLWQQPTTTVGDAPIAADQTTVVAVDREGKMQAFSIATGELIWSREVPIERATPPVIDAGVVYAAGLVPDQNDGLSQVYAYDVADGSPVWSDGGLLGPRAELEAFVRPRMGPALDADRVFLGDPSGAAVALSRFDGEVLWEQEETEGFAPLETPVQLAGDRLYAGPARFFDAASGTPGSTPFPLRAAAGGLGYGSREAGTVSAIPLGGSSGGWSAALGTNALPALLIAGPTTYVAVGGQLYSFGTTGGENLYEQPIDPVDFEADGYDGLAAGAGALFVASNEQLTAGRPILEPPPSGVDMGADGFDVDIGTKVSFVGGIARDLLGTVENLELQVDPAPFDKFKSVSRAPLQEDGTTYVKRGIGSNSRVRFALPSGAVSTLVVRAYPDYRVRVRRVSRKRGQIKGTVLGIPPQKIRKLKMVGYFGDKSKRRYKRLGKARIRPAGKRKAVGKVRFKLLKPKQVGKGDVVAICVRKLAKRWGRNVGLQKSCGKRRVRYAKGERVSRSGSGPVSGQAPFSSAPRDAPGARPAPPSVDADRAGRSPEGP